MNEDSKTPIERREALIAIIKDFPELATKPEVELVAYIEQQQTELAQKDEEYNTLYNDQIATEDDRDKWQQIAEQKDALLAEAVNIIKMLMNGSFPFAVADRWNNLCAKLEGDK